VAGVKKRYLEGGRLFGMVASWELRVASVPAFFHVFHSGKSLEGWLETAQGIGRHRGLRRHRHVGAVAGERRPDPGSQRQAGDQDRPAAGHPGGW
jgi:hypothetical protein